MRYRIDRHSKTNILLLLHPYRRDAALRESLRTRSLKVLYEQIETEDVVENMNQVKQMVAKFASLFPPDTAGPMIAQVKKYINGLPETSKVQDTMLTGSDEELKSVGKEVAVKTDNVVRAMAAVNNAIQRVIQGLVPYAEKSPQILDKKISELFTDPDLKDVMMPEDKFKSGVEKAFVPSKSFDSALAKGVKAAQTSTEAGGETELGQLFSTAAKFFVGMSQKKKSVESFPELFQAFMQYLNSSTIKQLQDISLKLKTEGNNLIIGAAEAAGEAGSATAAAAGGGEVKGQKRDDEGKEDKEDKDDSKDEKSDEEPAEDESKEPGEGEVKVDDVIYKKSPRSGNWYEKGAKSAATSAKKVMQDEKLLAKIKKAAGENKKPAAKPSEKKTGTKAENFKHNDDMILVERWQKLAGIL